MTNKFYLTTPIYYANYRPHVGSAYTTIVCDVIARYKRMCGYDVAYLTGTDEHGVNIERAAEKLGIPPAELVERNRKIFIDLWKLLGISYTDFVSTTELRHTHAVQTFIKRTLERDRNLPPEKRAIYKAKYEGRYCIYDNLYVSDTPEPADCQICGRPAELISEENYFFRLSGYQEKLLALYRDHPDFVQPDFRMNEVRTFVEAGLKDVSISRKSIKWGIPWPGDPEQVVYVWYDALTSYMTGVGYASDDLKWQQRYREFWPADLHMIGKEIIRFHAVYWPAFLMAAGLPLPKKIFAHGWLLFEQEKMSKSKGNIAYPEPIVKALDELTGTNVGNDALRYYLLRETVFGQDGNFSRDALLTRYNADLANGLGNLVSRVVAMTNEYLHGTVSFRPDQGVEGVQSAVSLLREAAETGIVQFKKSMDSLDFSRASEAVFNLVSEANQFLARTEPWSPTRSGPSAETARSQILGFAVESIRIATVMAYPILPEGALRVWESLRFSGKPSEGWIRTLGWLTGGTQFSVGRINSIYPRVEKQQAYERIEAMEQEIRNPSAPAATTKGEGSAAASNSPLATSTPGTDAKITIDDFAKLNLRVGVIQSAEKVAGADKLLKVLVDLGDEVRQIVAGIATAYAPETLAGRKVVIVANLTPRKLRGVESNGMILAASVGPDGKPVLCTFAEDVPPGSKVK